MSYLFNRTDATDFASFIGADTYEKGDELIFKYCPKCEGGRNGDKETFSINLKSGAFCCLRSSCDYKGHFIELARDFNFSVAYDKPKIYKSLPQPTKKIESRNEAIAYLQSRGISESVCKKYEITTHKDNPQVLVFPFFDETGKLLFIKYRNIAFKKGVTKGSKEWSEKDAMPILFGMNQCKNFETLIITEGQIDSLSVAQAGFDNAVSVPTGALGFTWLTPCWEWITKFKEVIVFGDYENGKITLLEVLKSRLPNVVKVVRKQDYLGEKDANAILQAYGCGAVRKAVENAEIPKIENVKDLSTVRSVNINELDKIKTGINEVDRVIGGMCMGQVVLLTGKRGEGKSTLMSQFVCDALEQNENVFVYSGELADFHFKRWIDYQLAGGDNVEEVTNEYGDKVYTIPSETIKQINDWYKGRCFIYENEYLPEDTNEYESLTSTVEKVIKQYNVRLVCIDNLMTAMDRVDEQNNLYLAQSNFVGRLKQIAMKYQVVIILVAHPRKSQNDFSNDDVAGSSDITNKVDIVMAYQRTAEGEDADSMLQITKNRLFGTLRVGKQNAIRLNYSPKTKRIFSPKDRTVKNYGWQKITADNVENTKGREFTAKNLIPFDDDVDLPF
jgi:twinkle protein